MNGKDHVYDGVSVSELHGLVEHCKTGIAAMSNVAGRVLEPSYQAPGIRSYARETRLEDRMRAIEENKTGSVDQSSRQRSESCPSDQRPNGGTTREHRESSYEESVVSESQNQSHHPPVLRTEMDPLGVVARDGTYQNGDSQYITQEIKATSMDFAILELVVPDDVSQGGKLQLVDPYADIRVGNCRVLDPTWNQTFSFDLDGNESRVLITFMDHNWKGSESFLGQCSLDVRTIILGAPVTIDIPLRGREGQLNGFTSKVEILLQ